MQISRVTAARLGTWPILATAAAVIALLLSLGLASLSAPAQLREGQAQDALFTAFMIALAAALCLGLGQVRIRSGVATWKMVGLASVVLSVTPVLLVLIGRTAEANLVYRAQQVPHNPTLFLDWTVTLRAVWCSSQGFDVSDPLNGCAIPTYYGPGVNWLGLFGLPVSQPWFIIGTGLILSILASLAIGIVARMARGIGPVYLLVCVFSASWLLLLERGNIDVVILIVGVGIAMLLARPRPLWAWSLAAAAIWLMGTWKYFPFAFGLLLIPVVRLRRGWLVLAGFAAATAVFLVLSAASLRSNANGLLGDFVWSDFGVVRNYLQLGRVLLNSRMATHLGPMDTPWLPTLIIAAVCLASLAWGLTWARPPQPAGAGRVNLALVGAAGYLTVVLIGGFGYSFKAALLLLCIPLLSSSSTSASLRVACSGNFQAILVVISCLVVSNGTLATLCGFIAASFALGAAAMHGWHVLPVSQGAVSPSVGLASRRPQS